VDDRLALRFVQWGEERVRRHEPIAYPRPAAAVSRRRT